jgi:glycosyltransferase involved in cell wall biosynthesis
VTSFQPSFDVLFVIESCPLWYLVYAKARQKKIVQRLDGVYHPALPGASGRLYWLKNVRLKIPHNFFADHIVYQSTFSQASCETMLGKPGGETTIIYNGVEPVEAAAAPAHPVLQLVTAGNFRRRDQIEPIISAVEKLAIPYHLNIFGPFTDNLAPLFSRLKNNEHISYHGPAARAELHRRLANHDIFLFSDQSACPHAVLEALASSLPVVAYDRGAAKELVTSGSSGEIVPLRPHDPLRERYHFSDQDSQAFADAILKVSRNLGARSRAARQEAAARFSLEKMADAYLKTFSRAS